ncbi:MAG: glycoside hydrolase family 25 protein [Erythrobacter sp.]
MANKHRGSGGRKRRGGLVRWLFRVIALLALIAIGYAAWFWWDMRSWRPSDIDYPEQGAVIPSKAEEVNFTTLKAVGAQFVYLELQPAQRELDDAFAARFLAASEAGLKIGVILPFDPCIPADPQSARFTRMVPRAETLMPPAIGVTHVAKDCAEPVSNAAVESELLTLANQVEMHSAKPVILRVGEAFEAKYKIAGTMDRDLWLMRDRARPDYAPRPWLLWSANSQMESEASEAPLEWVVVQR